jgi:uncharacterized repeat protein (TIGR03803 family)
MTKSTLLPRSNALVFAFGLAMALGSFGVQALQAQTYTVLHAFTGHPDGDTPLAGVTLDSAGNIYGTAYQGGNHLGGNNQGDGTVWKIDANGVFSVLYTFTGGVGQWPQTPLLLDGKRNLYGTAALGGHHGQGSVYSVAPNGQAREFYAFSRPTIYPQGRLALDRHRGILYGTTLYGGGTGCNSSGCGTVWQLAPAHHFKFLHKFAGASDGEWPGSGVVRDLEGNLFGVTRQGGVVTQQCPHGCGTAYKIARAGRKSNLHKFQGGNDGSLPAPGDLVSDGDGNLYGTTATGGGNGCGSAGCGTVFKISRSGQETVLYSFQGSADGSTPNSGVVLDGNGGLYGTTFNVIFHIDANGKVSIPYTFTCSTDGCNANGDLVMDAAGALYGTTKEGGDLSCMAPNGCGVVFKLVP